MRNVIEARLLIEPWAAGVVAGMPVRRPVVTVLEQQIADMIAAGEANEPLRYQEADRHFHEAIVAATENTHIAAFYSSLRDRQRRIGISLGAPRSSTEGLHAEHQTIASAIDDGDVDQATRLVRDHIGHNRDALEPKLRVN